MVNAIVVDKGLESTKEKFVESGAKSIHVISDFDGTITKTFVDGKKVPSIISILREENYLNADYSEKAKELFAKYHPIEIDQTIPLQKRKMAMHEWWKAHFDLLIKHGLNKKHLEKVVDSEMLQLREGTLEFFDILHQYNIPLIIMSSSGIGEAISMIIGKYGRMYKNVYIISNNFEWDKDGNAVRVKEPIIHSLNKDEIAIKSYPAIFRKVENRKNVLLLGNAVEDVGMITGFNYDNLIKIGFCDEQKNIELYKKYFDIVITDGTFYSVNKLLKDILQKR
jgi:5'-nucleotidase